MERRVHMVDWYRVDAWGRMRRVLIFGPLLLSLGGVVVAVSFATRVSAATRDVAHLAGMLLIASGALVTMIGMQRILRDDAYLSIRTDGVMFHTSYETFIAWDDLVCARWDVLAHALLLERRGAEAVVVAHRFATIAGPALAERIEQARRRAAMGMAL